MALTSNTVSILLGNGDGTFQTHVNYYAGLDPFSLTTGDFGDYGVLDLAVVNQSGNTVTILPGNGDGAFGFAHSYATGTLPFGIVTGDFNLDGQLDLAVANYTDGTVSILLGNGDGTFNAHADYATGAMPEMLAIADLNGDGKLDLVVGTNQATASQISILLGNGDGTFQPHRDLPAGSKPRFVIPADFNGDGKIDLAVANYGSSTVSLLLGKGDGTFPLRADYPTGLSPTAIAVGDFAGNGRLDVAVSNYGSNTASVLLQTPSVLFSRSNLSFKGQDVGTTSLPQTVTLTNNGSAPLNVTGIGEQGDFAQSNNCNLTVTQGKHCNISIIFTPTASGTRSGVLAIADNLANSPQTVSLSRIGKSMSTVTAESSLNPSFYGQAVNLTSQVKSTSPSQPTGTVTFKNGGSSLGTVPLVNGFALLTKTTLPTGTLQITATYGGDSLNDKTTSPPLSQIVNKATTATTVTSLPNPSVLGQSVKFTATVKSPTVVPVGTVTFTAGTTTLGQASLAGGKASLTTSALPKSTTTVTATYNGTSNITGSSGHVVQTVK